MIVIGLISILSAVSLYSWQRYVNNTNLKTAAREVMSDLASRKQKAVSEGIDCRLTFTAGANNYTISASPYTTSISGRDARNSHAAATMPG